VNNITILEVDRIDMINNEVPYEGNNAYFKLPKKLVKDEDEDTFSHYPSSFNIEIYLDRTKMREQKDKLPKSETDWSS